MTWDDRRNPPIIVIGAARSGTKFLRDILAAGRGANAVGYDVNYVWRYGVAPDLHDRLDPDQLTGKRRDFIRSTISRLARLGSDQCLVEKTVSNTLRVPFVSAIFPNARFVHLIRDGRDVTESAMRQWQGSPDLGALWLKLKGLPLRNFGYAFWFANNAISGLLSGRRGGRVWGPRYPGIDEDVGRKALVEICALQWTNSVCYALDDLARTRGHQVFEVRYEDLVASPKVLSRLVENLELPDRESILAKHAATLRSKGGGRWQSLPNYERAQMEAVLGSTARDLGYCT